jgi:hypothetical protein
MLRWNLEISLNSFFLSEKSILFQGYIPDIQF